MSLEILRVEHLTKIYKKNQRGIKDINFKIEQGKIYGLIGPNGAGKTTLIKTIIGAYANSKYTGKIYLKNQEIDSNISKKLSKIAYVPEKNNFPSNLKVKDYLVFLLSFDFKNKQQLSKQIIAAAQKFNWTNLLNRNLKTLSSGEGKKVLILQALAINPEIIIMDEPTANLDPDTRIDLLSFCKKLTKEGVAVIISSHVLSEVENFIDETIFIFNGKIVKQEEQGTSLYLTLKVNEPTKFLPFLKNNNYQFTQNNNSFEIQIESGLNEEVIIRYCLSHKIKILHLTQNRKSLLEIYRKLNQKNS